MKEFLIVFQGQHKNWNEKTEKDWQALNEQHAIWMKKLNIKSGAKLAAKPYKILSGNKDNPKVTDGPFAETKELLTGFYVIEAESLDHAVELAKGVPWLLHDKVEIFEIEN